MTDSKPAPDEHDSKELTPRRAGRLPQEALKCSLGEVVNMSATGAKVRCRIGSRPSEGRKATVEMDTESGQVRLQARVVWVRICGILRWEAGLEFVDVTDEQNKRLTQIAHGYYDRKLIKPAA